MLARPRPGTFLNVIIITLIARFITTILPSSKFSFSCSSSVKAPLSFCKLLATQGQLVQRKEQFKCFKNNSSASCAGVMTGLDCTMNHTKKPSLDLSSCTFTFTTPTELAQHGPVPEK
ncbi:hypothetical protein MTO96_040636 [Rhipicephalus appendiculatus]